jgi:dTDP-4-dehydrorhamnose reductase
MGKILVLGAGGMLGHKLCQRLGGQEHDVVGVTRQPAAAYDVYRGLFDGVRLVGGVDVLDDETLKTTLHREEPDFVINCIGLVKQHDQAGDPYLAIAINSLLPHRLARLSAAIDARLVHISTDCVFDGRRGRYRESDLSDARDLYGRSKALGETGPGQPAAVTLRTSFIGRELAPPRRGLLEWFLAQQGGSIDGYAGVIYSGLTSLELADVIGRVVDEGAQQLCGVHHVAGEPIAKYDLLELVREIYGLDVEIRKVDEPVLDRSLEMGLFSAKTGYRAPAWPEMIRRMKEDPTPYDAWRSDEEEVS